MTACDSHTLGSGSFQHGVPTCDSHMLGHGLWLILHMTRDDNKVTGLFINYKREYVGLIL